jgi:hypothetical protein
LVKLPIALAGNVCKESIANLNQLLAEMITLRDLYKKHHWQLAGPNRGEGRKTIGVCESPIHTADGGRPACIGARGHHRHGSRVSQTALENLSTFEGAVVYYGATPMEAQLGVGDELVVVGGAEQAAVFLAQAAQSAAGQVSDSGEGRWTINAAIDEAVPVPVHSAAPYERFSSRGDADFQDRALSAIRYEFDGHLGPFGVGRSPR